MTENAILVGYEILGPLGQGGFGKVWLARSNPEGPGRGALVAVKRLRRGKLKRLGNAHLISRLEEAFRFEAEIGTYLSHPNLVRVLESFTTEHNLAMVMEFVNGIGLDELIGQQRRRSLPFPPDIARDIVLQACRGLHFAHSACNRQGESLRIVHRYIKPGNIMVSREGVVKLMDFGVARSVLAQAGTTTGTIKGTLRYLSPEHAAGSRELGPASDQFAMGLVLAELLNGRPVYDAPKDHEVLFKAMSGRTEESLAAAEQVFPGVGAVLGRALKVEPTERFPSVGAFADALEALAAPAQSFFSLQAWVHRGLEQRADDAEEDGRSPLDLNRSSGYLNPSSPGEGMSGDTLDGEDAASRARRLLSNESSRFERIEPSGEARELAELEGGTSESSTPEEPGRNKPFPTGVIPVWACPQTSTLRRERPPGPEEERGDPLK